MRIPEGIALLIDAGFDEVAAVDIVNAVSSLAAAGPEHKASLWNYALHCIATGKLGMAPEAAPSGIAAAQKIVNRTAELKWDDAANPYWEG